MSFSSLRRATLLLMVFIAAPLSAQPILPELTPKKVTQKSNEIMQAHVTYKEFNQELAKRTVSNFLDELDPNKTYFIKSDIEQWLDPSDSLQKQIVASFQKSQFPVFEEIYAKMVKAVERRRNLEEKVTEAVKNNTLPKDVDPEEFKKLEWATSENELLSRLLKIRSLQQEATKKLDEEEGDVKEQAEQRIAKRRKTYEDNFIGVTAENKQKFVLSEILKAFASSLDSHTNYLTPVEASQMIIAVQQRLFGIGAQLRDDINGLTVVKVVEGGPADAGKELLVKDKIIAVNGVSVIGMDITEAVELIRGPEKSEVRLSVIRKVDGPDGTKEDQKKEISITRGEVVLKENRVESSIEPFGDGVLAHLRLFSFYQDPESSSAKDLADAFAKIQKDHKVKGVILDLRSNSGGLLVQAVAVTGLFITKGIVCSIMDHDGNVQHLRQIDNEQVWDGPLIVLVNRGSASASEIVAQTLQDYGRAIVVGEDTFGKGTFQTFTLTDLENGIINPEGEYKVTRGRYYTVSGKSPQLVGVQADISVQGVLSFFDIGEKFEKYPLANDKISANFDDNLSDIPWLQRKKIRTLYSYNNLQPRLTKYYDYLTELKQNSALRIEENKGYQAFLKEIQKKKKERDADAESIDFGQVDLQYQECLNIMRDLILFQLSGLKAKAA